MGMSTRARKRIILLCIIVLVVGIALPGAYLLRRSQKRASVERAFEAGMAAHAAGDHAEAVKHLRYFVSARSGSGEAYLALAKSLSAMPTESARPLLEAAAYAEAAGARLEGTIEPRRLALELYARAGRINEGLLAARELLAIDPKNYEGLALQAKMLIALRRWDSTRTSTGEVMGARQAADLFRDAYPEDPDAQFTWFSTRLASPGVEDTPDALRAQAQRLADSSPDLRLAVIAAWVLERQQAYDASATVLLDRLPREPASADASLVSSLSAEALEAVTDAIDKLSVASLAHRAELLQRKRVLLEIASRTPATAEPASLILTRQAWKDGRLDDARAFADRALAADESPSEETLGWALLTGAQPGPAALASRLDERDNDAARFWRNLYEASRRAEEGAFDVAASDLARLSDEGPEPWICQYLLGRTLRARGDVLGAIAAFERANAPEFSSSGPWFLATSALAESLASAGRHQQAFEQAKRSLLFPGRVGTPDALLTSAFALSGAGQLSPSDRDALDTQARQWSESTETPPYERSLSVRIFAMLGDDNRAVNAAQGLLNADDATSLAQAARAIARVRPDLADRLTSRAEAIDSDDAGVVLTRATLTALAGDITAARAQMDALVERASPEHRALADQFRRVFLAEFQRDVLEQDLIRRALESPASVQAQLDALDTPSIWKDAETSRLAVDRLRALVGDDGATWKPYFARWIITHAPERAREIEPLLAPMLQGPQPDQRIVLLAAEGKLLSWNAARSENADPDSIARLGSEALALYERAAALTGTDPSIALRIVSILQDFGSMSEAGNRLDALSRATTLTREQRETLAALLERQGRFADAAQALAQFDDPSSLSRRGVLLARAGDVAGARSAHQRAIDAGQTDPASLTDAAALEMVSGQEQAADRILSTIEAAHGPLIARRARADALVRANRLNEAHAILDELAQTAEALDVLRLAYFSFDQGEQETAIKAIARGLRRFPNDPSLIALRDRLAVVIQGDEAVLAAVDPSRWGESVPPDVRLVADILRQRIDGTLSDEQALSRLHAATRAYPTSRSAWRELIRELDRQQRAKEAFEAAQTMALMLPASAEAAQIACRAAVNAGDLTTAISLAGEWRRRALPKTDEPDAVIASLNYQLGRPALAIDWVRQNTQLTLDLATLADPGRLPLVIGVLIATGDADDAFAHVQSLASRDPAWYARSLDWLNLELMRAGSLTPPRGADLSIYDQWLGAIEAQSPTPEVRRALLGPMQALALASGDSERCRRVLTLADDLDQSSLSARDCALLATCCSILGDLSSAEGWYEKSLALDPENPIVLNNLAYLHVRTASVSERSLSLIDKSLQNAQRLAMPPAAQASFLETRGRVLLALSRPQDALAAFDRATALNGPTDLLRLGRGESLLALDRTEEARGVLGQVNAQSLGADDQARLAALRSRL